MKQEEVISRAIKEDIVKNDLIGAHRIALYPFGNNGSTIKEVLETEYGFNIDLIVDNKLADTRQDISSFEDVNEPTNFFWIITCEDHEMRRHFCEQLISCGVKTDRIVDFWKSAFKYRIPYLDIVEKGHFLEK